MVRDVPSLAAIVAGPGIAVSGSFGVVNHATAVATTGEMAHRLFLLGLSLMDRVDGRWLPPHGHAGHSDAGELLEGHAENHDWRDRDGARCSQCDVRGQLFRFGASEGLRSELLDDSV